MAQFTTFDTKSAFLIEGLKPCSPPDYDCTICLNSLETDLNNDINFEAHTAVKTLCGHVFGAECIRRWNMQSNTCPMCVRALFVKEKEEPADYTHDPISIQEEAEHLSYRLEALLELLYEELSHDNYRVLFLENTMSSLSAVMMVFSRPLLGFEDLYDGVGFSEILPTMSVREKEILYAEIFDVLWHLVGFCERQTWDYGSGDESEDEDEEDSDEEKEGWFRGSDDDDCWGEVIEGAEEEEVNHHRFIQIIGGTGSDLV